MKYKKKVIFFVLAMILFASLRCTNVAFKGRPTALNIEIDETQPILYGYTIPVNFYLTYSNGKTKKINGNNDLSLTIEGANLNNGSIEIDNFPENWRKDEFRISAKFNNGKDSCSDAKVVAFNYFGPLILNFNSAEGNAGNDGSDNGTPLLFKDGKNGDKGFTGENGNDGDRLTLFVWKDTTRNLFKFKVQNETRLTTYYYTYKLNGNGLQISVNGGKGGAGGKGGNGGEGKDGKSKEDKQKEPGNGGNGGEGGNGGNGGNGGFVKIFLHPNALEFADFIQVFALGGSGGEPGEGGNGGKGGAPLTGQTAGMDGLKGYFGTPGLNGNVGPSPLIIIEEFEF